MMKYDFAVQVGRMVPEGEPDNVLGTLEANKALHHAYQWASSKASKSVYANAAKVYIEGIAINREYEPNNPDRADRHQLTYILSNLTYWRGDHAKESRKALKDYSESIRA